MNNHPDELFSPWYTAPEGLENEKCFHSYIRGRSGPTGRKSFMIIADQCCRCGHIKPVEELTWKEFDWVRRWNNRRLERKIDE